MLSILRIKIHHRVSKEILGKNIIQVNIPEFANALAPKLLPSIGISLAKSCSQTRKEE